MSNSSNPVSAVKPRATSFTNHISSAPNAQFPPEANRYHLYVSLSCPFAHTALIVRELKGLASIIDVSYMHWHLDEKGWRFINADELSKPRDPSDVFAGTVDHVNGASRLSELYFKSEPDYAGRFTVPMLWDKKTSTVVNNESLQIMRMFNSEFNSLLPEKYASVDLFPQSLRPEIEEIEEWTLNNITHGAHRAKNAVEQDVYEREVLNVFAHLDRVEKHLTATQATGSEFLVGGQLTEADIRLFVTIVRFDPAYVQHFKCNLGMIRHDYPHTHHWLRYLYWKIPGLQETTDFDFIKLHYTRSHKTINPLGITPLGPLPHILPL